MVRVLLVRHAESAMQQRLQDLEERVRRGETTRRQGFDRVAELRRTEDLNGDPPLTPNGREQARLFADHWGRILEHKARSGELHVFVSPMARSLETAGALMRKLRGELGVDIGATLVPSLFEVYGIGVHPADRPRLYERLGALGRLTPEGLLPRNLFSERQDLLPPGFEWTRGGLSTGQMRERHPWLAVPGTAGDAQGDRPWCDGRPESPAERDARVSHLVDWLEAQRDALADDDVVLLVTHGELTGRMLNVLFARCFAGPAAGAVVPNGAGGRGWVGLDPGSNTSVSCLSLAPGKIPRLDFFHRLDHLAPPTSPDTLMRGYQWLGWANVDGELAGSAEPVGSWGVKSKL